MHLILTFAWFDQIRDGAKRIEYRRVRSFWTRRIWNRRNEITRVTFGRAYTAETITAIVTKIDIGPCPIPGWDGDFYRIHFDLPNAKPRDANT